MTTLQYHLSNGDWINTGDRANEFVNLAVNHAQRLIAVGIDAPGTREAVLAVLEAGNVVRFDTDWHSEIRFAPAPRQAAEISDLRPVLRCRKCGTTGHAGAYPFSTLPGVCDDCA